MEESFGLVIIFMKKGILRVRSQTVWVWQDECQELTKFMKSYFKILLRFYQNRDNQSEYRFHFNRNIANLTNHNVVTIIYHLLHIKAILILLSFQYKKEQ